MLSKPIYFIIIFDLHGVRAQPNAEIVHRFMMHVVQNCLITGFLGAWWTYRS